jgi:hypothetical protein
MMRSMSLRAGITPPLTNHCIRATSVTALSDAHIETRFIKSVTGQKSDQSIESYNSRPSINQQERMSTTLSQYLQQKTVAATSSSLQSQGKTAVPKDLHIESSLEMRSDNDSHTITVNKQSTHMTSGSTFNFHSCNVQIYN